MEKIKKALSVILCAVMAFAVCVPAFAAQKTLPETETESEAEIAVIPEIAAMTAFFINAQVAETETEQSENLHTEEVIPEVDETVAEEEADTVIPEEDKGEEELPEENPAGDITQEETDGEMPDAEAPEEETPDTEIPDVIVIDDEDTYLEVLEHCLQGAGRNLLMSAILVGGAVCSPIMIFVFYPIGVVLALGGLPMGALCFVVGAGELVTSPVLALFIDTDTNLTIL